MKIFKSLLDILLTLFVLLLFASAIWALWERNRDPLSAIDLNAGKTVITEDNYFSLSFKPESRNYRHLLLSTEHLGEIEFFISQPKQIPRGGLPVIIILGGLEVDEEAFRMIQDPGNNIFIIYRYAYSPSYWDEGTTLTQIPIIRQSVFKVPSRVLTLERWVSRQSWAESDRITLLGFSFGSMFLPAVNHLASSKNVHLNPGIISYGGADIYELLQTNLKEKISQPFRSMLSWLGSTAIYPMEPALHLPYMNNEFLIINGIKDQQISEQSWRKLQQLTPEPKTVILLDEEHMHYRKPKLTMKLVDICREWLLERELVN